VAIRSEVSDEASGAKTGDAVHTYKAIAAFAANLELRAKYPAVGTAVGPDLNDETTKLHGHANEAEIRE